MSKLMLITIIAVAGCGSRTQVQSTQPPTTEVTLAASCDEPPPPPPVKSHFDELSEGSCTK
jgi:hypothetical protein